MECATNLLPEAPEIGAIAPSGAQTCPPAESEGAPGLAFMDIVAKLIRGPTDGPVDDNKWAGQQLPRQANEQAVDSKQKSTKADPLLMYLLGSVGAPTQAPLPIAAQTAVAEPTTVESPAAIGSVALSLGVQIGGDQVPGAQTSPQAVPADAASTEVTKTPENEAAEAANPGPSSAVDTKPEDTLPPGQVSKQDEEWSRTDKSLDRASSDERSDRKVGSLPQEGPTDHNGRAVSAKTNAAGPSPQQDTKWGSTPNNEGSWRVFPSDVAAAQDDGRFASIRDMAGVVLQAEDRVSASETGRSPAHLSDGRLNPDSLPELQPVKPAEGGRSAMEGDSGRRSNVISPSVKRAAGVDW